MACHTMSDIFGLIDLGGTKILSLIADGSGRVYGHDKRLSLTHEGLDAVLGRMEDSLVAAEAAAGIEHREISAVGIACPGAVDVKNGVVSSGPHLPGWQDVPLRTLMTDRLACRVVVENDGTAAALGEYTFGSGRGTRHMLYVTVSTGVGGGVVVDGELYHGASGAAGEVGHVTVDPSGPLCGCGGRGHLESFSSATSIARRGAEVIASGGSSLLARLVLEGGGQPTAMIMYQAARQGDESSVAVFAEAGRYLGIGLAGLVNIFNPEVIAIGGGVANAGRFILDPARDSLRQQALERPLRDVRILVAELGGQVGALGMAAVLMRQAQNEN